MCCIQEVCSYRLCAVQPCKWLSNIADDIFMLKQSWASPIRFQNEQTPTDKVREIESFGVFVEVLDLANVLGRIEEQRTRHNLDKFSIQLF